METIAVAFHIFICLFLIGVIMLQAGKGADVGAVFGGASQTLFGGRGPATFLNKLTIIISVLFLLSAVGLARLGSHKGTKSVVETVPVEQTAPAAAPAQPSTPTDGKK